MTLSSLAIRYRPIVITFVVLLMAWGVMAFMSMPRREDPEYTVRTCAVITRWPGASAEKVEELITDPLEEAISSINDVDVVRSTSTAGLSEIYVDSEDRVSAKAIGNVWDKVRARVDRVEMPEDNIVPEVDDDFGDTYVLLLAVYQTPLPGEDTIRQQHRYSYRELDLISQQVKDALRLIPGVARADQFGVRQEAIYIETDMGRWSQLAITTSQLQSLLESRNIVAPGGNIDTRVGRFSVKPGGEFNAVDEINSMVVAADTQSTTSAPVQLKDLGLNVVRGYDDPPRLICRYGDADTSEPSVVVALTMKSGANINDICAAAKQRIREMREIEQVLPADIDIAAVSDQSENVTAKIDQVIGNVIGAIVIVVVVVYLVVGFRTAAVMAANIPVVVLASLALITVFGVQLEQISLASIIIALGLLVDNAIQVCDQSRTNQINGMAPSQATVAGSSQLSIPMLIGTATTVAAFFPMLIGLTGSNREYIYSLPVTLSVTLGISWVLAMSFCTILAATFIRPPRHPNQPTAPLPWLFLRAVSLIQGRKSDTKSTPSGQDALGDMYERVGLMAVGAKWVTVAIAVAMLIGCFNLPVGSEFFPRDLRDQFVVEIWLPENVTIEDTDQIAQQVEATLRKLSPVEDEYGETVQQIRAMRTMVGGGGARWYLGWTPEGSKANYAEILIRTTDARFTSPLVKRIREVVSHGDEDLGIKAVIGARVIPQELFLGPSAEPIALRVIGSGFADQKKLQSYAEQLKTIVRQQPGTWDVTDSWGAPGYQLRVDVHEEKANLSGVTNSDVARTLNAYYSGHRLTTLREGDHLIPIYLRLRPEDRMSLDELRAAYVEGSSGKVPLDSIATVVPRWEAARIERRDQNRVIEVKARVEEGVLGNNVVDDIMASEAMKQLQADMPSNFWIEVGGTKEESSEASGDLAICFGISIILIVLCLVIQYNGWAKPLMILATLPLALVGALPGLYLTGYPLGFMPQLGILSLFGIVLNTGIIYIEFADHMIKEEIRKTGGSGPLGGLTRTQFHSCLVRAGRRRLLPIFLTTSTTIGGLLPLAVAGGPLWAGMAWCMIFGLLVATLLTLLVVPALYAILVEHFGVRPVPTEAD